LSKALRLLGHKVTVALPRYPEIEAAGVMVARRLTPISLPSAAGEGKLEAMVFDGRLGSGVELLLLDFADPDAPAASGRQTTGYFERPGIYGHDGADYADNARRYGLFCRAVVELVKQRAVQGQPFDVVHAHDWPTALVPYLLREGEFEGRRPKSVLTIHNLAHQGVFPRAALAHAGLDDTHFQPDKLEFYGQVNFLKAGILAADALTTVSNTYARAILTPEEGEKLDGVLRLRQNAILGIVNGIDYAVYNPMTDPALVARYDAEDTSNKARCKTALYAELGLELVPERPLVASIGRVVHQKGSDLLATSLPKMLKGEMAFVGVGDGDPALVAKLRAAVAKTPERAQFLGARPEAMVHKVLAAADFIVMPSRYEPCGLVQLYAQRYGAVPIVSATGGLVDTVVDLDAELETGTGFLFEKGTATGLVGAVQRALAAFMHPRWPSVRRRVMRLDLGWDRPARRYASIYKTLTA
ncbi:MAG TPA: glycogen/starch synthase, partial [Byssovorax sp.]